MYRKTVVFTNIAAFLLVATIFSTSFTSVGFGQAKAVPAQAESAKPVSGAAMLKANRASIPVYTSSATAAKEAAQEKPNHQQDQNRPAVVVPSSRYRTIQSALIARECKVVIRPGYYKENLTVFPNSCGGPTLIQAKVPGTVTIDGGNRNNTVSLWIETDVVLENLTLINNQRYGMYDVANVQGWGGIGLRMLNCTLYSRSVGVSTAYAWHVEVINSKLIGLADDSVGITTYLNNEVGQGTGVRLFDNLFAAMDMAVYNYELHDAGVQTVKRCQGNYCTDSNQYSDVNVVFEYENGL